MGIWKRYSWAEYYEIVEQLAMGFLELGIERNDKVCILGENRPHVYWFELASLVCGMPIVGIFSDCSCSEVKYFIQHSGSRFVVCQDQEQVDKVLEIKDEIPNLNRIIYWEEKGMWNYNDPLLLNIDKMRELGRKKIGRQKSLIEKMICETKGDDVAILFYSSGTTGIPKAAIQTNENMIKMVEMIDKRYPVKANGNSLSFLPIAWITEQIFDVCYSLFKGFIVNFPEKQETVQENIREVGPETLILSPRQWENHIKTTRVKIIEANLFNRMCFNVSLRIGYKVSTAKLMAKKISFGWKLLFFFADKLIFRPLRDRLGLSGVRLGISGGTGISPDVISYFHAVGIPLAQVYCSSECGVATMHPPNQIKAETCGTPLDNFEIKISELGEIIIKSPCLFKGYYKEPEKTVASIKNGFFYTGDFGRLDKDKHLIVMDRMEDLQEMAGDKKFSPQFAEIRLRFSAYIKDAFVVGEEREDYASAIIDIDYNNVGNWAGKNHIVYTTFSNLSQKEKVIELIKNEIKDINICLPKWASIKKFVNLHKEFDADEGEMTRTRKVRRNFMEEKYKEIIKALHGNASYIEVAATASYKDGKIGKTKSKLYINSLD